MESKPHIVCIPFPAQGHVNPFMQLAKLLHSSGFHITFVNTEFNHRRLLRAKGPDALRGLDDFRFETIPDGLTPSDQDATQDIPALCISTRKNCAAPLTELVKKLNSSSDIPNISCIISDGVMTFAIQVAQKLGIPAVQFWTASACGMMGYFQYSELVKRGFTPSTDDQSYLKHDYLDTPIIPGNKNMRLKDIPSFLRTRDPDDIMLDFLCEEAQNCLKSSAVILNTFDDLEYEALGGISSKFPNIYTMGYFPMLSSHFPQSPLKSFRSASLWKEDLGCLKWLDERSPNSVVFVNFGSIVVMSDQQLIDFGWGLANSKHLFLWIIRPAILMGDSAILPKEFIEEIKDRGMIANWCPQDLVLAHPSVGGFLTHCGWNSTIESMSNGVPVICWPNFAEQQINCRYICNVLGMGMEIDKHVRTEEIEMLIRELMEGEKGKKMKQSALTWKKKAKNAAAQGGTSYKNLTRFIEVLVGANAYNQS